MSRIAEAHFGDRPATYPDTPGFKEPTTSKAAAESINAETLRADVLARIKTMPSTADEVADFLQQNILSIRPRVSELRKKNLIAPNGERRPNASGRMAAVLKAL